MSCTTTILTETVYIGRDNFIDFQMQDDSDVPGTMANTDLSQATKIGVKIGSTVYDSVANPTIVMYEPTGHVTLNLGGSLTAGIHEANIILYDSTHPNGVMWEPMFYINAI
jgi:hypothetical protein